MLSISGVLATVIAIAIFQPLFGAGKWSFSVKPIPSWVMPVSAELGKTDPSPDKESGLQYLLSDYQTRVSDKGVEHYYHQVERVASSAGLDDVSQLAFEFEPTFQELVIHQIRIIRDGKTIDALKPREIKVVQREAELSKQIYNGTLSALVFLNDVRTGDVIDYAYSINGENPVLKGRYAESYFLTDNNLNARIQYRLLWPASRPITIHNRNTEIKPSRRSIGSEEEYIWNSVDAPLINYEDSAPSWYNPSPSVQISEFQTWSDVIQWALPLYSVKNSPSPALSQQIDHFRRDNQSAEDQMIAAVRFVQDEVRYMGIELGPNSHQPGQPSVVFERRFGDCKDKSLLLSTILNSLGIEAHPALVNTDVKTDLTNWQPTPFAFNHCIVNAKLSGKTYWLDPTIGFQRGRLEQHYNPDYAVGLVLAETSRDLEKIPESKNESPTTVLKERYTAVGDLGGVQLEVVTTYRGSDADDARAQFKGSSLSEMGRTSLNYYAKTFHSIDEASPLKYDDDEDKNIFTVTGKYRIRDFWKGHSRDLWADRIYSELTKPNISQRAAPLGIHHPAFIEQIIEVALPFDSDSVETKTETITGDAIRLEYKIAAVGNTLVLDYKYRTLADSVSASKVSEHIDTLERARDAVGYGLKEGEAGARVGLNSHHEKSFSWMPITVVGLIVAPLVLIGGLKARRVSVQRRQLQQLPVIAPGEAPATAVEVADQESLTRHVTKTVCRCKKYYQQPGDPINREGLMYDGRRLIVVQLRCSACNNSRDVYYALQFEKAFASSQT